MKKIISLVLAIVLLTTSVSMLQSCNESAPNNPYDYTPFDLGNLMDEFTSNPTKIQKEYVGEWCSIGWYKVSAVISEEHFALYSSSARVYIDCWVKSDDAKDKLHNLNIGDTVQVYGKVTQIYSNASSAWDISIEVYHIGRLGPLT